MKPCEPDNQGPAVPPIRQSDYEHLTRIGKRSYHIEPYAEQQNTEAPCTEEDPAHCKHLGRGVGMEPSTPPTPRPLFSPPSSTPPDQSKIETWLRRCQDNGQPIHICILLESHWGFESEWATQDYHALHTGLNRKQGGIRVLIHKTFIASQGIRLATVVPGRLLQIRLDTEPAITVFAVYQAVWNDGAKQEDSRTQREQLWSRLNSSIKGVPQRSQLLIAGDFNTPCLPQPPFVGPSVLADPTKVKQKDQHRLQQLISMHNLVALNTWGRCKHSHTYQFDAPNITPHPNRLPALSSPANGRTSQICSRHYGPVCTYQWYATPSSASLSATASSSSHQLHLTAKDVTTSLRDDPTLAARFQNKVLELFRVPEAGDPAVALNQALLRFVWALRKLRGQAPSGALSGRPHC